MTTPADSRGLRAIDRLCDEFEAAWHSGARPLIEDFCARVGPDAHGALLRELLLLEFEFRWRQGEAPQLAGFLQRFPNTPDVVRAAFDDTRRRAVAVGAGDGSAAGLVLTSTAGPHQGKRFSFVGHDVFLVGRAQEAHLSVHDGYLSRYHFLVEINPPDCRLTDLGSRHGTFVNGQRVRSTVLHDKDLIQAGHSTFLVSLNTAGGVEAVAPVRPSTDRTATAGGPGRMSPEQPAPGVAPAASRPEPSTANAAEHIRAVGPASSPVTETDRGPRSDPSTVTQFPCIAGYRIERELGRGGMGIVYLAVRERDDARVALKIVEPHVAVHPTQIKRFLREADILRQLQHRHIITYLESGESNRLLYFVMEFVEGADAARYVKQRVGDLPVRTAVRIVCQLLSALQYAHEKGFVHRDIKPANLLIAGGDGHKWVKLADFGLARVYQASRLSGLTVKGEWGGTIAYMAPEQITHFRDVLPSADQYSAAATLYHLLTRSLPFDFKSNEVPALSVVLQEEPVPIRERRPDLPGELAAVVHRALAKNPVLRFPDVSAFRAALARFVR